jgi:hypothetical protein
MHWKIRRDRYLSLVCDRLGEEAVFAAGFFLDDDPDDEPLDDVDWLCTPRPKRRPTGEHPVALLSTGGFCPVHDGHIAMMERARLAAEQAGFEVLGGYLSPGHDAYLRMKCGKAALPAYERLRLCAAAVAGSDWLSVDPWEAMHRRVAVNYTDVTARLSAYLRTHVDPRIEVLYVCGADNARFGLAFSDRGGCIVVGRKGAEAEFETWRAKLAGVSNVLWAPSVHDAASRNLRTATWQSRSSPRVVVRTEDSRAVRTLGLADYAWFQAELLTVIRKYATARSVPLGEAAPEPGVISLDAMLPAAHNLAISRLFAVGGYEALGHVARPGADPLAQQIATIPVGRYALCDDDCITGATLAIVRRMLPARVGVTEARVAVEHEPNEDVVDARDFLLGADHGGLVLELPGGSIGRAPYLLPYVDPAARASIPASHEFSLDVWSLNARIFASTDLRVRHMPAASRATFPFPEDERLEAVCAWHVERLRRIAPKRSDGLL